MATMKTALLFVALLGNTTQWEIPQGHYTPFLFTSNSPQYMFDNFEPPRMPWPGECLELKVYETHVPKRTEDDQNITVSARWAIVPCR